MREPAKPSRISGELWIADHLPRGPIRATAFAWSVWGVRVRSPRLCEATKIRFDLYQFVSLIPKREEHRRTSENV